MTIYIDIHEPLRIQKSIEKNGIPTKRVRLSVGDYSFSTFCIERKTVSDFLSSIYSRRLYKQIYKLSKFSSKPLFILQGEMPTYRIVRTSKNKIMKIPLNIEEINRRKKVIRSNLALIYSSYNVPFYMAKDENDLVEFIVQLYLKSEKKEPSLIPLSTIKKSTLSKIEVKTGMLGLIPLVGKKLANYLAKNYTIEELARMEVQELKKIKGIGKEIAVRIKETLTT